jgi:MoxR-like ATPase
MPEWHMRDPDRRDGEVYVASQDVNLAVDVALATGRPILVRGEPGSGKSALAPFVARERLWRYYEHVVTSRTQATDLLWSFDSVRRLADAQTLPRGARLDDFRYVEPGVLWWAFAPVSAANRGAFGRARQAVVARRPAVDPMYDPNKGRSPDHAVVLIDEIDKADPDMPNSLLVPLGSSEFVVTETGTRVRKETPKTTPQQAKSAPQNSGSSRHLIVVTTNEERELPQAFLRRCVIMTLPPPTVDWLVRVAGEHISKSGGTFNEFNESLARALAEELMKTREEAVRQAVRPPSTAEFLDALRACVALEISLDSPQWAQVRELTLAKRQEGPDR